MSQQTKLTDEDLGEKVRAGLEIRVVLAHERLSRAVAKGDRCKVSAERMEILARECEIAWVKRMIKREAKQND